MLKEISAAIEAIGARAEFAVEQSLAANVLELRVRGVGRVAVPVTEGIAAKLIAAARPAPFGVRDETRHDERVRSTWEIRADQVAVGAAFDRALAPKLATVGRRLGLAGGGALRPVLDKLLVYGPGQFFAPHQDSERGDGMLATLVVVLPSRRAGGRLVVSHKGKRRIFEAAPDPSALHLVAFYADCRHEVQRVTQGYRISLTYHLLHEGAAASRAPHGAVDRLATSVKAYFSTPAETRFGSASGEPPDRLVYLLDHEYTQRGLAFERLKGADRVRVAALLSVADGLDLEAHLALTEVHETWGCEGDEAAYRSREHEDDDEGRDPESYSLGDLHDSDVQLGHWVGRDGAVDPGVSTHVGEDEVCWTRPSVEFDPFRSEHEGYMGNYGNTVDRWYRRAAVVLWPRSRRFVLRARASPAWAVDEVGGLLRAGGLDEARGCARVLLSFWPQRAGSEQRPRFFGKVARLALALDEPGLASGLLAPLGPDRITAENTSALVAAAEHYGLTWSRDLFERWRERQQHDRPRGLAVLPVLARALATHRWDGARPLGEALLHAEIAAFRARVVDARTLVARLDGEAVRHELVREVVVLLEAVGALDSPGPRDELLRALVDGGGGLAPMSLVAVLQQAQAKRAGTEIRRLDLDELHAHVEASLRASLARPPRAPSDWSIEANLGCRCELCRELTAFLRDPVARDRRWPLAKERRRHVHSMIEMFDLPVAHDTVRQGSPFVLVLEKQAILFAREAKRREAEAKALRWVQRARAGRALRPRR
jgi:hypothetical protein